MSRTRRSIVFASVVLVGFMALLHAQSREGAPQPIPNTISDPNIPGSLVAVTPGEGPLVAPGPAPDIIFIYTGRVIGNIEPCG